MPIAYQRDDDLGLEHVGLTDDESSLVITATIWGEEPYELVVDPGQRVLGPYGVAAWRVSGATLTVVLSDEAAGVLGTPTEITVDADHGSLREVLPHLTRITGLEGDELGP